MTTMLAAADPIGPLIMELRALNIASGRVRGYEAQPGDALDPGHYQRFVVLVDLGGPPGRNVVQRKRIAFRAYGATPQDAGDLYMDIQEALHLIGPRTGTTIYMTRDDTGGSAHLDPDTEQPYYDGVFVVTQGVTP